MKMLIKTLQNHLYTILICLEWTIDALEPERDLINSPITKNNIVHDLTRSWKHFQNKGSKTPFGHASMMKKSAHFLVKIASHSLFILFNVKT